MYIFKIIWILSVLETNQGKSVLNMYSKCTKAKLIDFRMQAEQTCIIGDLFLCHMDT